MTDGVCREIFSIVGAIIWGISWINAALVLLGLYGLWALYKLHTTENGFSMLDFITDIKTGKGDTSKLHINIFAVLSVWLVVVLVQKERYGEVVTLTPIILGTFVLGRVATNIWGKNSPTDQPSQEEK